MITTESGASAVKEIKLYTCINNRIPYNIQYLHVA